VEATTRFPDLIRGLSCRDGVAALVAGLGLEPDLAVIPPSAFAAHGIDLPCVRAACRLFERGVSRGILVELDGDVTARIVSDLAMRVSRAGGVLQALLFVAAADWSAVPWPVRRWMEFPGT